MDELDTIRAVLYSKSIDSSNVKPYTGLHLNTTGNERRLNRSSISFLFSLGDLILSTPSLESYRVNNDPIYRYTGNMSLSTSGGVDKRILSYDTLETRRYQTLKVKQPVPHNVTRILQERCE